MTQHPHAEALHVLFAAVPDLHLAYLFGSRICGDVGAMSDYDFAVLADRDVDRLSFQTRLTHELVLLVDNGSN